MSMTGDRRDVNGEEWARLDRHALVMSIWLVAGFVAVTLFAHGCRELASMPVIGGFMAVLAGFIGHVIINAVGGTVFTAREVALGLVVYGSALLWFMLALLFDLESAEVLFFPLILGFIVLPVVVIFYMIVHFGVRGAFDAFDVIRDFRP